MNTRKLAACLLAFVLLFSIQIAAQAANYTVADFNGSFVAEEDGTVQGWRDSETTLYGNSTASDAPLPEGTKYVIVPADANKSRYVRTEELACEAGKKYIVSGWYKGEGAFLGAEGYTMDHTWQRVMNDTNLASTTTWTYFEKSFITEADTATIALLFRSKQGMQAYYADLKLERHWIDAVENWTLSSGATLVQTGGYENQPYVECSANATELLRTWPKMDPGKVYTLSFYVNASAAGIGPFVRTTFGSNPENTDDNYFCEYIDYKTDHRIDQKEVQKSDTIIDGNCSYKTFPSATEADVDQWVKHEFYISTPANQWMHSTLSIGTWTLPAQGTMKISNVSLCEAKTSVMLTDKNGAALGDALTAEDTIHVNCTYVADAAHIEDNLRAVAAIYRVDGNQKQAVSFGTITGMGSKAINSQSNAEKLINKLLMPATFEIALPVPSIEAGDYEIYVTIWEEGSALKPVMKKFVYHAVCAE